MLNFFILNYGYERFGSAWEKRWEINCSHPQQYPVLMFQNKIVNGTIKAERIITSIPWTLWLVVRNCY
jgi:hypothetical protein